MIDSLDRLTCTPWHHHVRSRRGVRPGDPDKPGRPAAAAGQQVQPEDLRGHRGVLLVVPQEVDRAGQRLHDHQPSGAGRSRPVPRPVQAGPGRRRGKELARTYTGPALNHVHVVAIGACGAWPWPLRWMMTYTHLGGGGVGQGDEGAGHQLYPLVHLLSEHPHVPEDLRHPRAGPEGVPRCRNSKLCQSIALRAHNTRGTITWYIQAFTLAATDPRGYHFTIAYLYSCVHRPGQPEPSWVSLKLSCPLN